MFVFQAKCVAGEQPTKDENGFVIPGACEPCPMDTYKTQDSLDGDVTAWKQECSACSDRPENDGKDYTLQEGSTFEEQCMSEFI